MKQSPWAWVPTLYFAEGLPNVLVTGVAVVMYMQMGLSDTELALYTGWLNLPWIIKPLWSPFIDLLRTKRWWILAMQILIGAALAGVAFTLNTPAWFQMSMCCLFIMAFASATHDISADGFYMIELDEHKQTYFVGIRNTFYRLAVIFGNGVLVAIPGILTVYFRCTIAFAWSLVFYGLAGMFIGLWLYHGWLLPRPVADSNRSGSVAEVWSGLCHALLAFFTKFPLRHTIIAICFLLLYRFPEALLNTMTKTFLMRPNSEGGLGMAPTEYGLASRRHEALAVAPRLRHHPARRRLHLPGLRHAVGGLSGRADARQHLPLRRAARLRPGIHRAHALHALLQPRGVQDIPLFHLHRHQLPGPDAAGHGVGMDKGCGGLPGILHHRHGLLCADVPRHLVPQHRPRLWQEAGLRGLTASGIARMRTHV